MQSKLRMLVMTVSVVFFSLVSGSVFGQTTVSYTTAGNHTFIVPAGVTQITVEAWGGGAGGGAGTGSNGGGGGGGGSYSTKIFIVAPGDNISIVVGAGGSPNSPGQSSSILTILAGGGQSASGSIGGAGGIASGGTINTSGGNGLPSTSNFGGSGGNGANGGSGGNGASNASGNGSSGSAPGGGGGGGGKNSSTSGGQGASGAVKITYTVCTPTTWYQDLDGDTYGNPSVTQSSCTQPVGYVANNTDCNDNDNTKHGTFSFYVDNDNDRYGTGALVGGICAVDANTPPSGYATTGGDCNDANASVHPGATEIPDDGTDQDCDGFDLKTWYEDSDGDGYGNPSVSQTANTQPTGYVSNNNDCDDTDGAVNPAAQEVCNGIDDDCDGLIDDADPSTSNESKSTFYHDADGDGYGNPTQSILACNAPTGYVANGTDCDDADEDIHPGATDIPDDGIDQDCDGEDLKTWYEDSDGDGYGNPSVSQTANTQPTGFVNNNADCDDTDGSINPSATEVCNGKDDDCDGQVDEGVDVTPAVSIEITSGTNPTCSGTSVTFTATPVHGGTTPSYQWYKGATPVGTNSAVYEDDGTTAGSITVVMTSNEGCVTSATATSGAISLQVNALPNNVGGGFKNGAICAGELTASLTYDAANSSFASPHTIVYSDGISQWQAVINTADETTFDVAVTPTSNTDYTIISITDGNGCVRTGDFGDATASIYIRPLPTDKAVQAEATAICPGTGTNIQILSSQSGVSYQLRNDADDSPVGDLVTGTGGTINLPTGNISGSYTYNVLATKTTSNPTTNCSAEMSATVVVNAVDNDAPTLKADATLPGETGINACKADAPEAPSAASIAALFEDNCTDVTAVPVAESSYVSGDNCSWTAHYEYEIWDGNNNKRSENVVVVYSGSDQTAASLVDASEGPSSLNQTGVNECLSTAASFDGTTLEGALAALYSDNCATSVTATLKGSPEAGASNSNCSWSFTYTYTISDGCAANDFEVSITRSGSDQTAASLVDASEGPSSLNQTGVNECLSTAASFDGTTLEGALAALYSDNCATSVTATLKGSPEAGASNSNCSWSFTYTYTISDGCAANDFEVSITRSGSDQTAASLVDASEGPSSLNQTGVNECLSTAASFDGTTLEGALAALYSDNCATSVTATLKGSPEAGASNSNCSWSFTYTYTISDGCAANDFEVSITRSGSDQTAASLVDASEGPSSLNQTGVNECLSTAASFDGTTLEGALAALYSDNCATSVTATLKGSPEAGASNSNCSWSFTYTYTISDGCAANDFEVSITRSGSDQTAASLVDASEGPSSLNQTGVNECLSTAASFDGTTLEGALAALYSDNCATSVTATLKGSPEAGASNSNCSWSFTYTYTISDGCAANDFEVSITRSGSDQTAASLVDASEGPSSLNQTGVNECLSTAASFDGTTLEGALAALYSDNCATSVTATLKGSPEAGASNSNCSWSFTYTYTISDGCAANDFEVSITRSGSDQTAPVITANNNNSVTLVSITNGSTVNLVYDPSICGAVLNYTVTSIDACSGTVDATIDEESLASGSTFPFGTSTVKYTSEDDCGNKSVFEFTVSVGKAPTTSTLLVEAVDPTVLPIGDKPTQQYSDGVKLKVTVTGGASAESCSNGQAASGVNFYIAGQLLNSEPIALEDDGNGNLVGEGTFAVLGSYATPCGTLLKAVSAVLLNKNTSFFSVADPLDKELNIVKEDAVVNYTGTTFISTAYSTVDVILSASVKDALDSYHGDISKAKLRFHIVSADPTTPSLDHYTDWFDVQLANPGDETDGYVAYQWTGRPVPSSAGDQYFYTVYVEVNCDGTAGHYIGEDEGVLNIFKTDTRDFITGGGYVIPTNSLGTEKAENGRKLNFGFNIKWNKTFKNLQGKLNVIYRKGSRVYQVKTNATSSLSITEDGACLKHAVFTAKANITDVTDPLHPIGIASGLSLELKITDDNTGGADMWALTLYDKNTLVFSSQWSGGTIELPLGGGNVIVHSGTDCPNINSNVRTSGEPSKDKPGIGTVPTQAFNLSAFPNPTQSSFNVKLESSNTTDEISLVVYGINGQVIEKRQHLVAGQTIQLGAQYRPGMYLVEMIQGDQRKQVKLLKQPD